MAQGYPLHIPEDPLYYIGLEYLPESALEKLADILDVPGNICMELFAEHINREHENKLDLDTNKLQAFRCQMGQRPTKLLFRHLMKLGITIGQVQYVLDKMGAATRHIFRNSYNDITQMYNHVMMKYPSTSTATASEHNCTCIGCRERDVRDSCMHTRSLNQRSEADRSSTFPPNPNRTRIDGQRPNEPNKQIYMVERFPTFRTHQNPTNRRPDGPIRNDPNYQRYVAGRYPPFGPNQNNRTQDRQRQNDSIHENTVPLLNESRLPNNVQLSEPGQREIEPVWIHPSECDCQCGDTNCEVCEEKRLIDPEETTVLSSYPPRSQQINTRRSNIRSSSTTGHVPVNDGMNINDNVQTDYISYSENPSSSFSLRACPEGNSHSSSMKPSITSKHSCSNTDTHKCTCKKPPVCTCIKKEVHSSSSGDNPNRWSAPEESLYSRGIDSSRVSVTSHSDGNLCPYPEDRRATADQSGKIIFISYTDDVKQDVIKIAGILKRQGHTVNTDLNKGSFVSAINQGYVSEQDQYTWLRNRYKHVDYIIICSSKGYIEAINLDDKVCPSPHYLNAKYIFELIMQDPRKSEKAIEICFQTTNVKDKLCLPFTRKFILPNEMASLSDQIRR